MLKIKTKSSTVKVGDLKVGDTFKIQQTRNHYIIIKMNGNIVDTAGYIMTYCFEENTVVGFKADFNAIITDAEVIFDE